MTTLHAYQAVYIYASVPRGRWLQGRLGEALACVEEALAHTPTLIELHTAKAKILKHAGDLDGAAQCAEVARRMDLQDRYLNSTAVKVRRGAVLLIVWCGAAWHASQRSKAC